MENRSLLSALAGGCEGWAVASFGGAVEAEAALALVAPTRRQIWCALWAQMSLRADRIEATIDFETWRHQLLSESNQSLLRQGGFGRATGLENAFGRIGWMALSRPESYLELAELLERGGAPAKALRHLGSIDSQTISLLAAMPSYACTSKDIARLRANLRVTPNHIERQTWRIERLQTLNAEAGQILQRNFVTSVLGEASGDYLTGLPFPDPPWSGDLDLSPITSPAQLEAVARRFFNCLGSRMSQVRHGASYYYELNGVAVVEIERVSNIGWEVTDAAGPRNAILSTVQINQLRSALTRAPSCISPILPNHLTGQSL